MKTTEVIELLYKAMPNNNWISNLVIKESAIYFSWDGYRFRVDVSLLVEECKFGCLISSGVASLVERILKTYKNK